MRKVTSLLASASLVGVATLVLAGGSASAQSTCDFLTGGGFIIHPSGANWGPSLIRRSLIRTSRRVVAAAEVATSSSTSRTARPRGPSALIRRHALPPLPSNNSSQPRRVLAKDSDEGLPDLVVKSIHDASAGDPGR